MKQKVRNAETNFLVDRYLDCGTNSTALVAEADLMTALLQLRQFECEAHPLLGRLLHVTCHVHVDLTQPVNDMVGCVTRGCRLSYPDTVNIQHHLHCKLHP